MSSLQLSTTAASPLASSFVWSVPEKQITVALDHAAIEGALPEILRAFHAIPKRGAETGGFLIGASERKDGWLRARVTDIVVMPIQYTRGASYLLCEEERARFEKMLQQARESGDEPIGYFRTHTREGLQLSPEDVGLFDHLFPQPSSLALLVRPLRLRPPVAGFFFREPGRLKTDRSYLEFPFQSPTAVSTHGQKSPLAECRAKKTAAPRQPAEALMAESEAPPAAPRFALIGQAASRPWRWVLALCAPVIVAAVALFWNPAMLSNARSPGDPEPVTLRAQQRGAFVLFNWTTAGMREVRNGTLVVRDGQSQTSIELDPPELESGHLLYPPVSPEVQFTLEVLTRSGTVVRRLEYKTP